MEEVYFTVPERKGGCGVKNLAVPGFWDAVLCILASLHHSYRLNIIQT